MGHEAHFGGRRIESPGVARKVQDRGIPFSLVLLDVHMPELDGFVIAERITSNPRLGNPAVVMLTSVGLRGDAAKCRATGIGGYLTKPINRAELLNVIKQVMGTGKSKPGDRSLVTTHSLRESRAGLEDLVAEDNRVNQALAIRLLEKRGHTVVLAETGRAALNALEKQRFDLVLMDVQMPEMDGLEATIAIRQRERISGNTISLIIAMTANAMMGDRERCLESGMDAYLTKPLSVISLFETIERLQLNQTPARTALTELHSADPGKLQVAQGSHNECLLVDETGCDRRLRRKGNNFAFRIRA